MKRNTLFVIAALAVLLGAGKSLQAQDPYCLGLKNPTNFTSTGGAGNSQWTGYTGTKNSQASTCTSLGSSLTTTVQAADMESYNNIQGCSSVSFQNNAPSNSVDIHNNLDYSRQFVIKGTGTDPETFGHLSYLPPDTSFHSSIRLGNYCGYAGAERLTYSFNVTPQSALVTLWFAMSLQNGQHTANANPEFVVVVEKNIGGNWMVAAGDTLCYIRPTPANSGSIAPFYYGATGTQSGNSMGNIYLPWQKLTINLYRYMYMNVRISISSSDCAYSTHYGLCYIAGECKSINLMCNGCIEGGEEQIAEIVAPSDGISYTWYRSKTGILVGAAQTNETNYELIGVDSSGVLRVTQAEMLNSVTGDTLVQNTFLCKMTTSMNSLIPVTTPLYTNLGDSKPRVRYTTTTQGNTMYFNDHSYTPYAPNDSNNVDSNLTQWTFYRSAQPHQNTAITSVTGASASLTIADSTNYSMKVRVFTPNQSCWTEKTVTLVDAFPETDTTSPLPAFHVTELPANWTADSLVRQVLLGGGISVSNVKYNGSLTAINCNAIGTFTNDNDINPIGMSSGIILTTGTAAEAEGPNSNSLTSAAGNCTASNNSALSTLAGTSLYDVATLEFDFIPYSDSIEFRFIFASDEYPEYISSNYTDIAGAFLSGINPSGGYYSNTNIAKLPNGSAVSVGNVNSTTNSQYYVQNVAQYIEYDGYTTVLTAKAAVVPCTHQYHLSIAVGDAMDAIANSALLLQTGSLYSNAISFATSPATSVGQRVTVTEGDTITINMSRPRPRETTEIISCEYSGTATNGEDFNLLNPVYAFPANATEAAMTIVPFRDGIDEGDETFRIVFSPQSSCLNADSAVFIITDYHTPCDTVYIFDTVWMNGEYHTIVVTSDNTDQGLAAGNGRFPEGTSVEIAAIPIEGNSFMSWNDGITDNPRIVVVTSDTAFYAVFHNSGVSDVPAFSGWTLRGERGQLVVEGAEGQQVRIYDLWGRLLKTVPVASGVERYAVPASGSYVVQVADGPARKITVLRDKVH